MKTDMSIVGDIEQGEILLFRRCCADNKSCQLRYMINFLKSQKAARPLIFSFVEEHGRLLRNLSLQENILLESIPTTFSVAKEFQLQHYLQKNGNTYLCQLYEQIKSPEKLPTENDMPSKKIASLIISLLKNNKFLLYDKPEAFLDDKTTDLFINALKHQLGTSNGIAIIHSNNERQWLPHTSKIIASNERLQYNLASVINEQVRDKFIGTPDVDDIDSKFIELDIAIKAAS